MCLFKIFKIFKIYFYSYLQYSTFLGGSAAESGSGIAVDSTGAAYVTGATNSSNFPTTAGAYQTSPRAGFISKLNPAGSALLFSTYFGTASGLTVSAIAIDSAGSTYVTGYVTNLTFPTTAGAYQSSYFGSGGSPKSFLLKLTANGTALGYSTYFSGRDGTWAYALAVDSAGNAYIAGQTQYTSFPTTTGAM